MDSISGPQVKYLAGYAGTGKTSLAAKLVEGRPSHFCAYTGKAALVLRQKGCADASTIHGLIYKPQEHKYCSICGTEARSNSEDESDVVKTCFCKNARIVTSVKYELRSRRETDWVTRGAYEAAGVFEDDAVEQEPERNDGRIFELVDKEGIVVVDECSMVSDQVAKDLLSFGVRLLVLGDPFQLPPVNGEGYFTNRQPDWMLTEVHRQQEESGVIRLATDIRQRGGFSFEPGYYGKDVDMLTWNQANKDTFLKADQWLVGRNARRREMNRQARELYELKGTREVALPVEKDKLVCLRNDREAGLVNGGQHEVLEVIGGSREGLELLVRALDEPGDVARRVQVHHHHFTGEHEALLGVGWNKRSSRQEFDYGYVMTVHKSQGSAWNHVGIVDESVVFREHRSNWLYTAVTRAAERVTVVL